MRATVEVAEKPPGLYCVDIREDEECNYANVRYNAVVHGYDAQHNVRHCCRFCGVVAKVAPDIVPFWRCSNKDCQILWELFSRGR